MKELSLNILDIAMNSVKADADRIRIEIEENDDRLLLSISDNGCGMSVEMLRNVTDPFCTTRTTRKVGMGIPLLKLAAEQTGGSFSIESSAGGQDHGTVTKAEFNKNHIDFTPLGNVVSTLTTLIQGSPDIEWYFSHKYKEEEVVLDTKEIMEILGDDVSLASYEVIKWIEGYLEEGYDNLYRE